MDPPASSQDPFFMLSPPKWGLLESSWLSCFSPASSHSSNVQAVLHLPPPLLTAIALPSFLPCLPCAVVCGVPSPRSFSACG